MKSDVRTRVYNEYILTDDKDSMVAAILESDLWERIVEIMALTFKNMAKEDNRSIEDIIDDILSEDDFNS